MKNPSLWNQADLHHHLQQAVDLEFWTIPLYLTALYSVKGLKGLQKKDYPETALLIESVVIQEMLHLEIICNLCNALGYSPCFTPPSYNPEKGIPFIHPKQHYLPDEIKDYKVKPGPLDENTLKLFCAIELPHPKVEIIWNADRHYDCISELYVGLKTGISNLWDECFVGEKLNLKQKSVFGEYQNKNGKHHGFSIKVNSPEAAINALEAIVEQGEGADSAKVPVSFRPPELEEGKEFDPGWFKGHLSHYQKFRILSHHYKKLPPVYSGEPANRDSEVQKKLENNYRTFLKELEANFNSEENSDLSNTFWDSMFALKDSIIEVWESGACPEFNV